MKTLLVRMHRCFLLRTCTNCRWQMPICALWSTLNAKAVLSFPCGSWVRFLIGVKMLVLAAKDEIGNLHEGSKELK